MKVASLLLNILNIGILGVSVVALLPTAMLFDAPGSTANKGLWLLTGVFGVFPLVAAWGVVVGWSKWSAGDFATALKWGAAAPVYAAVAAICLIQILE